MSKNELDFQFDTEAEKENYVRGLIQEGVYAMATGKDETLASVKQQLDSIGQPYLRVLVEKREELEKLQKESPLPQRAASIKVLTDKISVYADGAKATKPAATRADSAKAKAEADAVNAELEAAKAELEAIQAELAEAKTGAEGEADKEPETAKTPEAKTTAGKK